MVVCENQWRAFSELVVLVVDFLMLKPTISTLKNVMHGDLFRFHILPDHLRHERLEE